MEKVKKDKKVNTEAFSHIEKKSFFMVVFLLIGIIAVAGISTLFVPQGNYQRNDDGMIINGTFQLGQVKGIELWRVITAPVRVLFSVDAPTIITISIFLLVMSGVFNLLDKTGGLRVIIGRTVAKFSNRKHLVVILVALIFMAFGSFFGMFEELVTLLPLIIVFMLSLGFDTLTGLGACMLSACFGFSAAITNPFSVGIVCDVAHTSVTNGVWLRIVFFCLVFTSVCTFLMLHIRKITKNPKKSLTYALDSRKRTNINLEFTKTDEKDNKLFKTYMVFFIVQLIVLCLIASVKAISEYAIPILAVSFLVGGITAGLCVVEDKKEVFVSFYRGAIAMLPAIIMILLATSVKLIMTESGILDTVMYTVVSKLEGKSKFLCVILIYLLILFLQIFIGSSSAKILLIMPIILPIAEILGLSTTVIILTYCMADGFTDVILPTNPVLLVGLSIANVSYAKWVKWTWKFQLLMFLGTVLLLLFAIKIGY